MTIYVNGEERFLTAWNDTESGVEWTQDLLGAYDALHYDEEVDGYTMTEDEFSWWVPVVEKLNQINELEEELGAGWDGIWEEYRNISTCDLDSEVNAKLEWLKSQGRK